MVVMNISKDVHHVRGSLGGPQRLLASLKGAQNAPKMTKMTTQREKMTKVIKIDKQAPFLD